ncbi:MAG: arylsulfatase [Pseudomonadota bacterium]
MNDDTTDKTRLGRTIDECQLPDPPAETPRRRRPNVLMWVMDDVGYGHLSPYGGMVDMPVLEGLAGRGMTFSNAHVTPLCSPTRACLLTGRNHHSNHMAAIPRWTSGIAQHDANIPRANGFLSEMLVQADYATMCVGKWHLTPIAALNVASSREGWPLGRGFERFYGFLAGQTSQFDPHLVVDNGPLYPPRTSSDDYHLSEDLVDVGIRYIRELRSGDPDKPFFMYLSFGASHAPHHAPREWIDRFRGRFDMGWDAYRRQVHQRQKEMGLIPADAPLPERDPDVPAWDSFNPEQQKVAARMMEAFAGMTAHMDHQVGRLLKVLGEMGELDDTLVIALSDNGASSEGGAGGAFNNQQFQGQIDQVPASLDNIDEIGGRTAYNHFPWGWAWAGNTPFRRWKRETYRGGCGVPFIVSWPRQLPERHGLRTGFIHAIDVAPTVLELLGLAAPQAIGGLTQSPIEGVSFAAHLADPAEPSLHTLQYYEILGHRSLYMDGWRAVCPWPGPSWTEGGRGWPAEMLASDLDRLEGAGWELYRLSDDPGESRNLAQAEPAQLRKMVAMWWHEAGKYGVLPILGKAPGRKAPPAAIHRRVFYPETAPVFIEAAPNVINTHYRIRADLEVWPGRDSGMLLAHGGRFGGYGLMLLQGRPRFVYNYLGVYETVVAAEQPLSAGAHVVEAQFTKTGRPTPGSGLGAPGIVRILVDGQEVASAPLVYTAPVMLNFSGSLTCGYHHAEAFGDVYEPPFVFGGRVRQVEVFTHGEAEIDEALLREVWMKRQ